MNYKHLSDTRTLRTTKTIYAGIFASLTAICSWISISLFFTPVPINFALIGPYLAGLLLGSKFAVLSQATYVMLGAIGLPVFSGFTGGLDRLLGPTGGFILGYIICAFICGLPVRKKGLSARIFLMVCGLIACYLCGLCWFSIVTNSDLLAGIASCVLPFLPGDAVKIVLVAMLTKYLPELY